MACVAGAACIFLACKSPGFGLFVSICASLFGIAYGFIHRNNMNNCKSKHRFKAFSQLDDETKASIRSENAKSITGFSVLAAGIVIFMISSAAAQSSQALHKSTAKSTTTIAVTTTSRPTTTARTTTRTTTTTEERTTTKPPSTVYWGVSGTKYHIDPYCRSFQGEAANSGTIKQAKAAGRADWCGICSLGWSDSELLERGNPFAD